MSRFNSPRLTAVIGVLIALALAAARYAPVLAATLEWQQ